MTHLGGTSCTQLSSNGASHTSKTCRFLSSTRKVFSARHGIAARKLHPAGYSYGYQVGSIRFRSTHTEQGPNKEHNAQDSAVPTPAWLLTKALTIDSGADRTACIGLLGLGLVVAGSLALSDSASAAEVTSSVSVHHSAPANMGDLAEGQEFWSNVTRYGRYFVTVMLGTTYVMTKPFTELFKRPLTAILAIALLGGGIYFLKFTLEAMLAIQEPFEYSPSSPVTYGDSPYLGSY